MVDRFTYCLNVIFDAEGGLSAHKSDRGGMTMYGVTQRTYDRYRQSIGRVVQSVASLTKVEAADLYETYYWSLAHCDSLPAPLDLVMFDTAVNSGVGNGIRLLQRALSIPADGIWGAQTRTAVAACAGPQQVAVKYLDAREDFYEAVVAHDPSQAVFLTGWKNRVDHLRGLIK